MKILLVLPPTAEKPSYAEPPSGLLYVASAMKRAGHQPTILDIYRNYVTPQELLDIVRTNNYETVGFGGITTCYWYVREASHLIRRQLPSVHLIAGGVLSSVHELLLQNTPIDVVCLGEGEITATQVINRLATGNREFDDIKGVIFRKDGRMVRTPRQPYIDNLDDIPIPSYELIDMNTYGFDAMRDPIFSVDIPSKKFYKEGMRVFNIKTARGCTNACAFCYRHFLGYRQHSVEYVINHIKYLQERYNIHFLRFGDELFTRDKDWVIRLAQRLITENVNIKYIVHGVRTDNVSPELMNALKKSGCVTVFIGFESGSQRILQEMRKNVTVEQNIQAVRTIIESGLNVMVQTVIGMPGENNETIGETIDSLVKTKVSPEWLSINYAQAYPGTWLWQYGRREGLITDQEKYLIEMGKSHDLFLNYTSIPDETMKKWRKQILTSIVRNKYKSTGKFICLLGTFNPRLYSLGIAYQREGLKFVLKKVVHYFRYYTIMRKFFHEKQT